MFTLVPVKFVRTTVWEIESLVLFTEQVQQVLQAPFQCFTNMPLLKAGRLYFIFNTAHIFSLSLRIKYFNVFINLGLTQMTTSHPNSNGVATGTSFVGDRARTLGNLCCRHLSKKSRGCRPSPAEPVAHTRQQHYFTKAVLFPPVPSFAVELITAGYCDVCEQLMKEFKVIEGCSMQGHKCNCSQERSNTTAAIGARWDGEEVSWKH